MTLLVSRGFRWRRSGDGGSFGEDRNTSKSARLSDTNRRICKRTWTQGPPAANNTRRRDNAKSPMGGNPSGSGTHAGRSADKAFQMTETSDLDAALQLPPTGDASAAPGHIWKWAKRQAIVRMDLSWGARECWRILEGFPEGKCYPSHYTIRRNASQERQRHPTISDGAETLRLHRHYSTVR
jgi:hypothetical protein